MEASRVPDSRAVAAAGSKGRPAAVVLVLGVVGGLLLVASEFSTIVSVDILTGGTCAEHATSPDACRTTGFEQHGGALLLLGALAVVMTLGAARRGSRPAALALLVIAVVAVGLTVIRDIPKADDEGLIGLRYSDAEASPGSGLYMEVVGAGLCALAGVGGLRRRD